MYQLDCKSAIVSVYKWLAGPARLLAVILVLSATLASAQQPSPAKTWRLNKVEFSGLQRFNQSQVEPLAGLQTGKSVDEAAIQAATDRLRKTGFFKSVVYRYQYLGEGLDLTFQVEELKWDTPVIFDNFVWFTDEELLSAARQAVPTFDGSAPRSGNVITALVGALEQLLRERNLPAQVEHLPSYDTSNVQTAHILSVKDSGLTICALRFPDASAIKESELIKISKPLVNAEYSRSILTGFINSNLIPAYRERGHLRARFRMPQVKLAPGPDCKGGVIATMQVEEGLPYVWDKADWKGNESFSADELGAMLDTKPGEVANVLKADNNLKSVRTAYVKKGYITMKLAFTPGFDDARRSVAYNISIVEGAQYRMGDFTVTGLPEGDINRLKGKWKLQRGDIYDATYLAEYAKTATTRPISDPKKGEFKVKPDPESLTVNISLTYK